MLDEARMIICSHPKRTVNIGDIWRWSPNWDKKPYHMLVIDRDAESNDWQVLNLELGKTQYWLMAVNDPVEGDDWELVA